MRSDATPLLDVSGLNAWYAESHVLQGIDLQLFAGEVVTLLGRNGAGKSTTLKAIMSLIARRTGQIKHRGADIMSCPPEDIAARGIAFCPEDRGIFASLSVRENLMLPPIVAAGGMTNEEIFTLFPNLRSRLGNEGAKLSGGEQQMLAIARILRTGADILLLDEPTEGLAPVIIKQIHHALLALRDRRFTILLVEQNLPFVSRLADRHYIIEDGAIVDHLMAADLAAQKGRVTSYLGV
jgi:branched-chain amino acid transport system ATP-binding protein